VETLETGTGGGIRSHMKHGDHVVGTAFAITRNLAAVIACNATTGHR
jgi:hypothetical protein